jgi:hypothetical protein
LKFCHEHRQRAFSRHGVTIGKQTTRYLNLHKLSQSNLQFARAKYAANRLFTGLQPLQFILINICAFSFERATGVAFLQIFFRIVAFSQRHLCFALPDHA